MAAGALKGETAWNGETVPVRKMRRSPLSRFVNVVGMLEGWEGSCFSLKEMERNHETFASLSLEFLCVCDIVWKCCADFLNFCHCCYIWRETTVHLLDYLQKTGSWDVTKVPLSSKLPWSRGRGCIMSSPAWETNTHHKIVVPQEYKRWSQGKRTFWVIIHHFSIFPLEGERLFHWKWTSTS